MAHGLRNESPMFPHPCGEELERLVAAGADPATVVPDEFVVVRGGTKPMPPVGTIFSASVGPTLSEAACGVPHGQIRFTTVGAIRSNAGLVVWLPQYSANGIMSLQHVHVTETGQSPFSALVPNPVPAAQRIV